MQLRPAISNDDGFHQLLAALITVALADAHGLSTDQDYKNAVGQHTYTAQRFLADAALPETVVAALLEQQQQQKRRKKAA